MHVGIGGTSFGFDDPRNSLLAYFQQNLFQFSGAKSLAELKQFNSLLYDENGIARTFQEFRNACFDAGLQFNKNWLETEYVTALAAAQSALNWQSLQDSEVIEYNTVGDDRVRPAHAELDGFTEAPTNPIWNIIAPPSDWRCRCWLIPGISHKIGQVAITIERAKEMVPYYFQHNPGTSKILLDDDGYMKYQVGNGAPKLLLAEKNYGMASVESLYQNNTFPHRLEIQAKEGAYRWFNEQFLELDSMYTKDVTGVTVKVDEEMIRHTIEDNADNRFEFVANIPEVLKAPDEIWSYRNGDDLERYYIKYYSALPIVVSVNEDNGIRAYTAYEAGRNGKLNVTQLIKLRRGTLIYRK